MNEMRIYYVTKYALSRGVKAISGTESTISPGYVNFRGEYNDLCKLHKDVFETRAEAFADAEARRLKKIASLKKQIARLKKFSFEDANHD